MSSGVYDDKRKKSNKKGKAKMSQAEWDKLSSKQRDVDYGGSRFEQYDAGTKQQRGGADRSGGDR